MNTATHQRTPTLFLASSKESLSIAEAVKTWFEAKNIEVTIWSEDVFKVNRSYLETLLNRSMFYDYLVAIFSSDDEALIREEYQVVTRDNVIFEFGLFLGRLGINRTFMLLEDGVSLFSDWDGIKPAKFKRRDNMVSAVGVGCQQIMQEMQVAQKVKHFSMLPSTSLAVGYYYNFLQRVYEAFERSDVFTISERNEKGEYVDVATYPIRDRYPVIEVRIPNNLAELEHDTIKRRTQAFNQVRVNAMTRAFPFYIEAELDANGLPQLFDMPTTLLASYKTIQEIFTADFLARENNLGHIMDKEIDNFEKSLRLLMPSGFEREYFRFTRMGV
jgi:hypothetical protein